MCVIHYPNRGDALALRSIAIFLVGHVGTLALHE